MKYSKDGAFEDPVIRCTECQNLIFRRQIEKFGGCPKCGNRRMRNVLNLTKEEMEMLRTKQVDENFLKLFEEVSDGE
jgi:predicted  nucleic acid-binding Zn-ribbon protein